MHPAPDPTRWRAVRGGWCRIPPPRCTNGHTWTFDGPGRPREGWVSCSCDERHGHPLWTCRECSALVADDCRDVAAWSAASVPSGSRMAERATWRRVASARY